MTGLNKNGQALRDTPEQRERCNARLLRGLARIERKAQIARGENQ